MKQYFRTIGSIVAISAMIVMAASCKKDTLSEEAQQLIPGVERTISASATLPQDADKAHIDGSRKVIWDMGDELNINGTNVTISRIGPDGTVAIFDKSTVHANTVSGTDHYWAVYPTTLAGAYSGGLPSDFTSTSALTVHFPDTQIVDIRATDTLKGLTFMAAHAAVGAGAENISFDMRNIGTVIEFSLTPRCASYSRVDSIVFTSSNASLAGTFTVSNNATNPTITPTAGSSKLVVKFQDGSNKYISITGGKKVRVILPPLAGKNLNMKIYGNAKYMEKNAASVTLARNKYYTSAINFDVLTTVNTNLPGFSIAPNKRVLFSPGNLQWSATNGGTTLTTHATADGLGAEGTWRFAENQWDVVGDATNGTVYGVGGDMTAKCDNTQISATYQGWIDLFGWGTSGYHDATDQYNRYYYPYNTERGTVNETYNWFGYGPSINMTDPNLVGTSANYDWGVYNAIYNPKTNTTDAPGTWRTLTTNEWAYLLESRKINVNCGSFNMYGSATVNGVTGLVLLPDNWNPALCPTFTYGHGSPTYNIFDETTTTKWSEMEAAGCIFLPRTGTRINTNVGSVTNAGSYSSSTSYGSGYLYRTLETTGLSAWNTYQRFYASAVRLVKDVH